MKKTIYSSLCILFFISLFLTACGASSTIPRSSSKEYSIDDLSPLLEETNNLFEEKGKYLTDDEKYEEKGKKLYHKCAKEIGLPIDQDLIVRGYKGTIPFSFGIYSDISDTWLYCYSPEYLDADKINNKNLSVLIPDGDVVAVKGTLSDFGALDNTEFVSPSNIDTTYNPSDLNTLLSDLKDTFSISDITIYGEVSKIMTKTEYYQDTNSLEEDEADTLDSNYPIACIEDESGLKVYFSYLEKRTGKINIGDHIAISASTLYRIGSPDPDASYYGIDEDYQLAGCVVFPFVANLYNFSAK